MCSDCHVLFYRLLDLGITAELLESQVSQGSRSHVIGAYRIVVHRVQKQLSSFIDSEGYLPESPVSEERKETIQVNKKAENKFYLNNILNKHSSKDESFLNCWRRKASYDSSEGDDKNKPSDGKDKTERLSLVEVERLQKSKAKLLQHRTSRSAKGEDSNGASVVRSITCTIL